MDEAWELCGGLQNYGCWIWCLCYILQWDRRRGGSEGQSHSPGIWNRGTEICRNISDEKILSRVQIFRDLCCWVINLWMYKSVYFVVLPLVTRWLVWSQDVGGTGNCPGPWRPTVHQSVSIRDTPRKHRAVSAEKQNERNNETHCSNYFSSFPFWLVFSLIHCCSDHVTDPKPGTHHRRSLTTTAELFVCGLQSWWEPHIIGFVVCANYIHHQAPIIGSLSHSNWDFLSPSCHHDSYQRGSVNIWGQDCFITGKCFLHDLTTCSESLPQFQFMIQTCRIRNTLNLSMYMSLKKSFGILIICPAVIWLPLP